MGIKHFFRWFNSQFSESIYPLKDGDTIQDVNDGVEVDNFMLDMNGIFHNSAQKIYQYGNHAPQRRLLGGPQRPPRGRAAEKAVYKDVCDTIDTLFRVVKPKKRLVLCVDGPAPLSKQNQQRQRRFRSAHEQAQGGHGGGFDSNCITPGTIFMDHLTKYIDWWIRGQMTYDPTYRDIEIIFSNEKVPGEGEHHLINYIRHHGDREESWCVSALDADLIMLSLATHLENIYILREDLYDPSVEYLFVDIGEIHLSLSEQLRWSEDDKLFNYEWAINDFVFMCFMVGNDFLPHIPSIEIIEDGIELFLDVYRRVMEIQGAHLTHDMGEDGIRINMTTLLPFLAELGSYEKENMEKKLAHKKRYFQDKLVEEHSRQVNLGEAEEFRSKWVVDIDAYNGAYMTTNFPEGSRDEDICHTYIEGMQWVLSYYTRGVPNWKWYFPHHYAPPASVLVKYIHNYVQPIYGKTHPTTPFQQLLCVLPPRSAGLIPQPLSGLLLDPQSPLAKYTPRGELEIDLSGKRREWEGIVILPMVDIGVVVNEYNKLIHMVDKRDTRRNIYGKAFVYKHNPENGSVFTSYYGDIPVCTCSSTPLNI